MAPPLPSRIRTTIRSHRRASWFLLATLVPFFLPFLILCMPILLLFLAPVSVFLLSLLFLYKVKVFLSGKLKGFRGRADKGVGYQASRRIAAGEGLGIHQQAPREEVKGLEGTNGHSAALEEVKGVEDPNVQSVESHFHDKEGEEVDPGLLPSSVCEFEQEKLGLPEEDFAVQDDRAEDKREQRQLEQGSSVDEGLERSRQEWSPEYEEPNLSYVQSVELPAFSEAQGGEGLQRPERVRDFTEGALEDTGKELPQKERMQDDKQEEEEATQESIHSKDEQKQAERESHLTEETLDDTQKELPLKDRMQDDKQEEEEEEATQESIDLRDQQKQPEKESGKQEEEEAIQESIHSKDEQKQAERESDSTEETLDDTQKELPRKDDKQEEEEATQESVDLRDQQKQPERESSTQEEEEAIQESIHSKDEQKQAERESDFTEETLEDTQKELPLKDRRQDDKQEEEEATQESIDLTDLQKQPERDSDKQEEEEAIQESILLKDQQKQQPESESDFTEGKHMGRELPQKDRTEDDKQEEEEEEAFQESTYVKDEQKQPEREHVVTEGTLGHMGEELPHIDKMEDDTQEEEEAIQESIGLKDEKGQPERESEFAEGTPEDMKKELPHMARMEDYKQEEEETTQESIDSNNKQRQPERESEFFEGALENVGKELPHKDRMEDTKQVEEEAIQKSIESKDKLEQPSSHVDATSSHTSEEFRPLADEHESFDKPYSGDHQSSVLADWQGPKSTEDLSEKQESSHPHQFEEASNRLPSIEAEPTAFSEQIAEKPREELSEQFAIDTPATFEHTIEEPELSSIPPTHEHTREEPELSSKEDSSLEVLDNRGRLDKEEDIIFPEEPFEKETVEGEPSYRLPESHGQLRREPFAEETKDDEQPQTGNSVQDLATSFEAEAASEREEDYPSEATSSVVPSPHESLEGIEFQDRTREEQKIIVDINTIKKIVGYQGEPNASILEQIRALYLFLGMEPYDWAAEVDDLERVQAEIELLKVVVGVK